MEQALNIAWIAVKCLWILVLGAIAVRIIYEIIKGE